VGIWLLAGAAFAINCLVEREIDSRMARTARRPMARGEITVVQTLAFSGVIGGAGMWVLYNLVNPLTMWLTFATFVGYAVIYTIILKPATPQNIVIGGLSGAMPPALGWAAIANDVPMQAWILVLIIFVWTPPHFWALALFMKTDYGAAGIPMLPNVKGQRVTRNQIFGYSFPMAGAAILPFILGDSGWLYGAASVVLSGIFLILAFRVWQNEATDAAAMKPEKQLFAFSILYLFLLFALFAIDRMVIA